MEDDKRIRIGGIAIHLEAMAKQIDKEIEGLQRQKAELLDCATNLRDVADIKAVA